MLFTAENVMVENVYRKKDGSINVSLIGMGISWNLKLADGVPVESITSGKNGRAVIDFRRMQTIEVFKDKVSQEEKEYIQNNGIRADIIHSFECYKK